MRRLSGKMIAIIAAAAVAVIGIVVVLIVTLGSKESYRVIQIHGFLGEINMAREGEKISPAKGMNLKSQDEFTLKNSAELELLADSDKHIKALENTVFYISKTGNQNSGKLQFQLTRGTLLVEIENKLKDDEEFEIVTPNAITSVRGTEFSVVYYPEFGITAVSVKSGVVHVESEKDEVDATAGATVYVLDDDEIVDTIPEDIIQSSGNDINPDGNNDTDGENNEITGDDSADVEQTEAVMERFVVPEPLTQSYMFFVEDDDFYEQVLVKYLDGWSFDGEKENGFIQFSKGSYMISYSVEDYYKGENRFLISTPYKIQEVKNETYSNSDGKEIKADIYVIEKDGDLYIAKYDYFKILSQNTAVRIEVTTDRGYFEKDCINQDDILKLTDNSYFLFGIKETPKVEENAINKIAEDGIDDTELPSILYGGANADALKFCISIMQDCILAGNTNYIKAALNRLWYMSRIPGSIEPLSTNGGNTYSVDELNELFALMTEEKISDAQMPMMAKLEGDVVKYIVCDVSSGGQTSLYDVTYEVNDSMEVLVFYNYKKTYGSDGMSGARGEAVAVLAPDSSGKYVIKRIGDMTITEFNY